MRARALFLVANLLLVSTLGTQGATTLAVNSASDINPAFERVWERTDSLVLDGKAKRTWLWGPEPLVTAREPLAESQDGMREVQYYPKSRMEINNPTSDPTSPWHVTNGLLVYEMVSGRVQVGADRYERRAPARISIAGDTISDTARLSRYSNVANYESLRNVATMVPGQNQAQPDRGRDVNKVLESDGAIREFGQNEMFYVRGLTLPRLDYYEPLTGHNVPDVFWQFMNQEDTVYENGQYVEEKFIDWVYALGYPITEPYWIWIRIHGDPVLVMMQAFQRRVLTYNPQNEPGWQVEMGNVGSHYYMWRYGAAPESISDSVPVPIRKSWRDLTRIPFPAYTIFKQDSAWTAFYNDWYSGPPAPPEVDFSTEMLVLAAWGERTTTGQQVKIQSVRLKDRTLTINVFQSREGGVFQAIGYPSDLAAIPRSPFDGGTYTVLFLDTEGVMLNSAELTLP